MTLNDLMGLFVDTVDVHIDLKLSDDSVTTLYTGYIGDIPATYLNQFGNYKITRFVFLKDDSGIILSLELFSFDIEQN